jgi:hypothetical protein
VFQTEGVVKHLTAGSIVALICGVAFGLGGCAQQSQQSQLCVGFDSGDAVSQQYKTPGAFKGGTIQFVGVTVEKAQYLDLEKEAKRVIGVQ